MGCRALRNIGRTFSHTTFIWGIKRMSEAPAATPSKPRVLVADDEQVIANTLAIILNQAGFEARAVYSGEKAIESLDSFQPDMLISDVIMTGMTGIEAAIATQKKMPNCKILLFWDRPQPPICWRRRGRTATSSKSWPSRCIRRICWRSCGDDVEGAAFSQ